MGYLLKPFKPDELKSMIRLGLHKIEKDWTWYTAIITGAAIYSFEIIWTEIFYWTWTDFNGEVLIEE
jgi:hypothetical protein